MKSVRMLCLIASTLSACSVDPASHPMIVGGTIVAENSPIAAHTVALVETQGEVEQFCSGVLIEPNVVLTAAHCFAEKRKKPALFFGTAIPKGRKAKDGRFFDLQQVIQHPGFSMKKVNQFDKKIFRLKDASKVEAPASSIDDLALVSFEGAAPAPYHSVPIADSWEGITAVKAAGFGCLSTDCEEFSNRLREVSMNWVKTLAEAKLLVMDGGKNKGTCSGDSGGPDFIVKDGSLQLLAIVYSGPESCESGISVDTLVGPYRTWIDEALSALTI